MLFHRNVRLVFAIGVVAFALAGCGQASNPTSANPTPTLDTTPPPAPTGLAQSFEATTGRDWLSWSPSSAADVAGYEVYMYSPAPGRDNSFTLIASVGAEQTTLPLPIATSNESQWYRVRATDAARNLSPYSPTFEARRTPWEPTGGDAGRDPNRNPNRDPLER